MKRADFDGIAPFYDALEWLTAGRVVQRARTAHLSRVPPCGRMLLAGEGHGKWLAVLARERPALELCYLDASAAMARVAQRRLAREGRGSARVDFVVGDVMEAELPVAAFDAVSTQFFLDCFTPAQLPAVVEKLSRAARPDAVWLDADFCLPTSGWRRTRAVAVHWLMHAFFRRVTRLPARKWTDPAPLLEAAGWLREATLGFNFGLVRSEAWRRGRRS